MKKITTLVILFLFSNNINAGYLDSFLQSFAKQGSMVITQPWHHLVTLYSLTRKPNQYPLALGPFRISALRHMQNRLPITPTFEALRRKKFKRLLNNGSCLPKRYNKSLRAAYYTLEKEFHSSYAYYESKLERINMLADGVIIYEPAEIIDALHLIEASKRFDEQLGYLYAAQKYIALDAQVNLNMSYDDSFLNERYRLIHEIDLLYVDQSTERLVNMIEDIEFVLEQFEIN
jgi:hypothetical protein